VESGETYVCTRGGVVEWWTVNGTIVRLGGVPGYLLGRPSQGPSVAASVVNLAAGRTDGRASPVGVHC
jgi:hypothetical protein